MGVDENDFNILFSSSWWQALFSCFKKQLYDMILIWWGGGGYESHFDFGAFWW